MKQTFVALATMDHEVHLACRGMVNIAVPDLGSTLATLAKWLALPNLIYMDRRDSILEQLESASEAVRNLDEKYSQYRGRLLVLGIAESRSTILIQASVVSSLATCPFKCLCRPSVQPLTILRLLRKALLYLVSSPKDGDNEMCWVSPVMDMTVHP